MLLVFTRVYETPPNEEWIFGRKYLVGFGVVGGVICRYCDKDVYSGTNLKNVTLLYIHRDFLDTPDFPALISGILLSGSSEQIVGIAHPGENHNLADVVEKINKISKISVQDILKADYHSDHVPGIIKDNFVSLGAYRLHLENLKRFIENRSRICESVDVSALKHKIAHLFLALDTDIQGVAEIYQKNADKKTVAYWKEVLNANKENPSHMLADLVFFVTGKQIEVLGEKSALTEKDLVRAKSIMQLTHNKLLKNKLFMLSGLCKGGDRIYGDSPICGFFELLSGLCESGLSAPDSKLLLQVNEVLSYFRNIDQGIGWGVEGASPERIRTFNDWVHALCHCLGEIRDAE